MKIFLCRHGQTTGDIEDRYGGGYDDHLTELGQSQANELAGKLTGKGIKTLFTSPLIRAMETAEILGKALGCETETVSDLRERNQNGILTGMVRSEAKEKYPDLVELLKDYKNTIENAEDYDSFSKRVNAALTTIAKTNSEDVIVVTHGGPTKAILRQISYSPDYKIKDCAVAELEWDGQELKVTNLDGINPA